MNRQLELFEQYPLRTPCDRHCECEWCSLMCFEKRGYLYNRAAHDWIMGADGKPVIRDKKSCDWQPQDRGKE